MSGETDRLLTAAEAARMLGLDRRHFHSMVVRRVADAPAGRRILGRRAYDLAGFVAWARSHQYLLRRENLPDALGIDAGFFEDLVRAHGEPPSVEIDGERLYGLWAARRWARSVLGASGDLRHRRGLPVR